MRIIAGSFKGRKLLSPKGSRTRPTSDRVREAIFSIVGDLVSGAAVLDLYAGTGAMGLEALSRGARKAVFVESDTAALTCLNTNIGSCGCRDRSRVIGQSVISYLGKAAFEDGFELMFADPPYRSDLGTLTLMAISKHAKPLKRCLIILEHAPGFPPEPVPGNMNRIDTRKYGNAGVTFFEFKKIQEL
jgi:16S rRNA (guanine966-N2)-methyltransferase